MSPCQVYYQVLKILRAEWQTFVELAPWGGLSSHFIFTMIMVVSWVGIFHADPQQSVITGKGMNISLLFRWFLFAGLAMPTTSTLQGATIRAVAEVYTGKRPSWLACLKVGWKNMFKITCFGFLVMLASSFLMLLGVGVLVAIYINTNSSSPDYSFLLFFIIYIAVISSIVGATMIAGPSTIVVEGKSVIEAMKSSWDLCKTDICFIGCSTFCFVLLHAGVSCTAFVVSRSDPVTTVTFLVLSSLRIVWLVTVPLNMM